MSHQPLTLYLTHWCQKHGWTDLFVDRYQFWAFPPGGVLPLPVPNSVIEGFYSQRHITKRHWCCYMLSICSTAIAIPLTIVSHSPMPLIAAFACGAIAVGLLDEM